jgi:alkylated DNA nucleotide flippase Atl1
MLDCGSIASSLAALPKDRHNTEAYAQLYRFLELGWVDSKGNVRGYHDLDHLVGMLPAAARIVNEVLQLQTRTIWQNLRKFYPQLITVQEGSKDARRQGNSALGQTDPGAGAYPLADPQASGRAGAATNARSINGLLMRCRSRDQTGSVCMIIWVGEATDCCGEPLQCRRAHSPKDHAVHCCSPTVLYYLLQLEGGRWGVGGAQASAGGQAARDEAAPTK